MLAEKIMEAPQKNPVGRPKKQIDSFLAQIIGQYFDSDHEAAAQAWGMSSSGLRNVLQGHRPVSNRLRLIIHLSTQIPLKELNERL